MELLLCLQYKKINVKLLLRKIVFVAYKKNANHKEGLWGKM